MMETLENRFTYHAPRTNERAAQHDLVRKRVLDVATLFQEILPLGRELSLALTKLEEAMFWGNAALARQKDGAE